MELIAPLMWLDWVLLGLLFSATIWGFARGVVGMLAGILAYILSLTLAGRYTGTVVNWLEQKWLLSDRLAATLANYVDLAPEANAVPTSTISAEQAERWLTLPMPDSYKAELAQQIEAWSATGIKQTVAEFILKQLATGIISLVVWVVLAGLVGYVLAHVGMLVSDYLSGLPLVGTVNRLLGGVAGLGVATTTAAVALSVLTPLFSLNLFSDLAAPVAASAVAAWLLEWNELVRTWLYGQSGSFFF